MVSKPFFFTLRRPGASAPRCWLRSLALALALALGSSPLVWGQSNCPAPVTMQQQSPSPITLRFVGDLVLGNSHVVENIPPEWERLYFAQVADYLQSADAVVGNLEGVLTEHTQTRKVTGTGRAFAFRFPPHYAGLLRKAGFTALNVANNHSNDFGEVGFADTLRHLREAGVAVAGLKGEQAMLNVRGLQVAVLGFGFYLRQSMIQDLVNVTQLVAQARSQAQYVVVTFHSGAEGDQAIWHSNETETYLGEDRGNAVAFARAAIDAGADVLVGHGPHVLRSIECYKGKPIFYSLGNFVGVGGLSARGMAALSAIGGVQLGPQGQLLGIEFLPVVFNERKLPRPDERGFAAHLVNRLGTQARYSGEFLQVPAPAHSAAEFQKWWASTTAQQRSQ